MTAPLDHAQLRAQQALDYYDGAFCDMCGTRYDGEVPGCDCGLRGKMIPGSDLASALGFMREHLDDTIDGWRDEYESMRERAEAAEAERDRLRAVAEAAERLHATLLATREEWSVVPAATEWIRLDAALAALEAAETGQ